jgi:SAM-dependent methyltransferase
MPDEIDRIRESYARREAAGREDRYALDDRANRYLYETRERDLLALLRRNALAPLAGKRILDAGCGSGQMLRDFVRYGADAARLSGVDLLRDRVASAHGADPAIGVAAANLAALPYRDAVFDIVLHATVMSSVLDDAVRRSIAGEVLRVLRRGGVIVWYDFTWNPGNRDVRGVSLADVRRLFPGCALEARRVTLAPPISRWLSSRAAWLCTMLEMLPLLRTHLLVAIRKP